MARTTSRPLPLSRLDGSVLWPSLVAILLGSFLVLGAGFAHPNAVHNAAHDARHSLAFPCH